MFKILTYAYSQNIYSSRKIETAWPQGYYEFQRFLLRGKAKVKLDILLLCFGYNINKLHAKVQKNRLGSHMFPLKTA